MNRLTISAAIAALFLALCPAHAQTGVLKTIPARNPEGRILTQTEATLSRDVLPRRLQTAWESSEVLMVYSNGSIKRINALDGSEAAPAAAPAERRPRAPRDVADRVGGPDGKYTFTVGKSLYWSDGSGERHLIAESKDDNISYGVSVSRNEFGINEGVFWSDAGDKLAFYRKDESAVTEFPLLDITTRTGDLVKIKYPMNGMDSERISLGIYDLGTGSTVWAAVDDFDEDRYLTNISWSPDGRYVFIQVLSRSQKDMHLNMYRASDGSFVRTVLTEHDDRFVEPQDKLHFLKGSYEFFYRTDVRSGYKNIYLCDTLGNLKTLPMPKADVQYVTNDGTGLFYTSAEVSPIENHLYRIDIKKGRTDRRSGLTSWKFSAPVRLTTGSGWHSVSLNPDCTLFTDYLSEFATPAKVSLYKTDGSLVRVLDEAPDPLAEYARVEVSLGTVKSADGKFDNYYRLYKPLGFDPSKKYPVIVYVYGGPHSQMVQDRWLGNIRMWELYMAQRGYVVYVQDNRGTSNQGAEFEKAIHRQCGQAEVADQMEGIKMLSSLPWVDADRIGVHGWSYGGFMTISLMTMHPETFKVGVAGGPVIDWKWYEIMYGERYMDTPRTNPEGFEKTSLINKATNLKGKLLICQGAMDSTVVWQHSLNFIQECIDHDIQVDYFPYPKAPHNVAGRNRVHLMDKISLYFEENL